MSNLDLQSEFDIPKDLIYLNSGTLSYSPRRVIQAMAEYRRELESNPAEGFLKAWPYLWETQKELANFIGARSQDLFLRANITYALNDFLMALQLPKGSEILVSDLEYGAIVNICRHKAEMEGHSLKTFSIPVRGPEAVRVDEEAILKHFEKSLTSQTKLVVVSHVTTGSGLIFPVEKLAEVCVAKKIFLAVDGAHSIGSMPMNLSKTKVDFYSSNLHKWLMGPKGTGFGWVAPHVREHLQPKFAGWTSYEVPPPFDVPSDDPWTLRWMMCSTFNFSDYRGIGDTLAFWQKYGVENIWQRQKQLRTTALQLTAKKTGWTQTAPWDSKLQGPMVTFDLPEKLAQKGFALIYELKAKHNIQLVTTSIQGQWCLRLAPHIYNTEEQLEKTAHILSTL